MEMIADQGDNFYLIDQSLNPHVEKQIQITQSAKAIEEAMQAFGTSSTKVSPNEAEEVVM